MPPPVFGPQIPPPEDEDWETEIQEVEPVDWEKRTFGLEPYGMVCNAVTHSSFSVKKYRARVQNKLIELIFLPARVERFTGLAIVLICNVTLHFSYLPNGQIYQPLAGGRLILDADSSCQ